MRATIARRASFGSAGRAVCPNTRFPFPRSRAYSSARVFISIVASYDSFAVCPQVMRPCFSRTTQRAPGCSATAAATWRDRANPGRRYGIHTASSP